MMIYPIVLFLHIVGALGLFIGLGLEWTSVRAARRATTAEEVIERMGPLVWLRRLYPLSMVTLLVSGLYMAVTAWGHQWWAAIGLLSMPALPVIGRTLDGGRMRAVAEAAARESGSLSAALRLRLREQQLWTSIQVRAAIALGVVFLMSVKPGLAGSLLTIGVATLAGLAASRVARPGAGSESEGRRRGFSGA